MLFGKAGVAASQFSQRAFITRLPRKRFFTTMATYSYKYVIIGGGNATGYAADEFVNKGLGSDLAIISAEPVEFPLFMYIHVSSARDAFQSRNMRDVAACTLVIF